MRSVTYRFSPAGDVVAAGEVDGRELGGYLEAIHALRQLEDGSAIARVTVGGDPERIRACAAGCESVRDVQVVEGPAESLVQVHFEPSERFSALLSCLGAHAVVIDFPLEVVDAGPTLRLVATGHIDELKGLVDATRSLGSVTIEEVGGYDHRPGRLFAELTERQRQVLRTAIDQGYYDVPREVTYEDIARELDCSASTVGQHLRRIEGTVLAAITPADGAAVEDPPVH